MSVSSQLPLGTVTFLDTDIEGSTRLLHRLGDDYADALAEQRRVLSTARRRTVARCRSTKPSNMRSP
jgi:class 3 adenylate cyclase